MTAIMRLSDLNMLTLLLVSSAISTGRCSTMGTSRSTITFLTGLYITVNLLAETVTIQYGCYQVDSASRSEP